MIRVSCRRPQLVLLSQTRWLCSFAQQPVNKRVQRCSVSLYLFELENRLVQVPFQLFWSRRLQESLWLSRTLWWQQIFLNTTSKSFRKMLSPNVQSHSLQTRRKTTVTLIQRSSLDHVAIQQSEYNLYLSPAVFFFPQSFTLFFITQRFNLAYNNSLTV